MNKRNVLVLLATIIILLNSSIQLLYSQTLEQIGSISLSKVNGRISHMAYNSKSQQLYVAALSNNTLEIIDIQNNKVINSIKALRQPQDVVYIPTTEMIFVACLGDGLCRGYQVNNNFQEFKTQNIGGNVNTVRFSPILNTLFVGHGDGAINIYDANSVKLKTSIPLVGRPEGFIVDHKAKKIFVNVPKNKSVEVIDLAANKVLNSWKLNGIAENYPIAYDSINSRLFIGCRNPAKMVVIDSHTGKQIAAVDIDGDVNDIFYNSKTGQIYASCGDGYINIIKQEIKTIKEEVKQTTPTTKTKTPQKNTKTGSKQTKTAKTNTQKVETRYIKQDAYTNSGRIYTASGARTSLFVPDINQFFVAVPASANKDAQILIYEVR